MVVLMENHAAMAATQPTTKKKRKPIQLNDSFYIHNNIFMFAMHFSSFYIHRFSCSRCLFCTTVQHIIHSACDHPVKCTRKYARSVFHLAFACQTDADEPNEEETK